ncbi:putative Ig domain-containing protein [Candidatus Parabeggiatoa sp. HSG14]|uniref:putative Ig domain-containing protein n=1 Tax=Candidatus Parabeggiatoa sp. HSG14 TaxID=3055593 RepID=UPI0025A75E45|nr:putative Ig domain-containing protein [Thiotrichales bacterium HSG14]
MTKLKACIASFLLFWCTISTSFAIELSLNQARFIPNDTLVLTLNENWSGEADVYVAVTLPADDTLLFLTPPQNFVPDFVPYAQGVTATGTKQVLQMPLPAGLPVGEYTFYAAAMRTFFDRIGDIAETSFIYATDAPQVELRLGNIRFPDGVIGRRYSLAIEPESGTPPYQFSLSAGTLPAGLTLDKNSGLIQGEPSARGFTEFTVQVVDGNGNIGEQPGAIKVYGILSFGEHGTFKGCNGLQMAFNSAQDLDEIRIQQGTYECNGLEIPSSKTFEHGIKLSGGWDSSFENQSDDPALTIFDGGAKIIADVNDRNKCEEVGGVWDIRCYQEEPPNSRILTVSTRSDITIEQLSFQNGIGAIHGNRVVSINNCVFTNNSNGAVSYINTITNSTFNNNSSSSNGGAVSDIQTITNSIFSNNSARNVGGAVFDANTITNNTFNNNSASDGGAVYSANTIINSAFTNNSASSSGGAVYSGSTITNSIFNNNGATNDGGAVSGGSTIINSIFTNNSASSGTVVSASTIVNSAITNNTATTREIISASTIINCTVANNNGRGFDGRGTILNTIFAQNKVDEEFNDITPDGDLHVDYTLVNYISGAVDYGTHNIMGEPRFVNAENSDFHLSSGSPALNIGDSSVVDSCERQDWDSACRETCDDQYSDQCEARCYVCSRYTYPFLRDDNGNVIDLNGNPRFVGGAIDMGAYELQ